MPQKSVAKKVAKKAAKKVAKKAAKKTAHSRAAHDLRRCYEHFGRVTTLLAQVPERDLVERLVALAQELLRLEVPKEAADTLRAAEHLCFGALALQGPLEEISAILREELKSESLTLMEHAKERAETHSVSAPAARLYAALRKLASQAFKAERYRAASELARGAEALTHIHTEVTARLRAPLEKGLGNAILPALQD